MSAGYTTATLIDYVGRLVQRDDIQERIVVALNEAAYDLALTVRPDELSDLKTPFSTVDGDDNYDLDADTLAITYVVITNLSGQTIPVPLKRGSLRRWMLRGRGATDRGAPEFWLRRGNTIRIWPVPDDNAGDNYTIEIAYIRTPVAFSSATPATVSDFNAEWNWPLITLAAHKVFLVLKDYESASYMFNIFSSLVNSRPTPHAIEDKNDIEARSEFPNS